MDVDMEDDQLQARPYQTQLEEIAINKNTIIHLPTGSGKTFIAIRLIKRFREALQKPWGQGGKRTFFLVNTVPLVIQQKKVIQRLCPVNSVGAYSGEDNVDYWDKDKWDIELEKHQVVVMTSQILCDMITHSYIKIDDINLLIFDECHHAVEDHPMRMIMKHFDNWPVSKQPRVLGLTATLLNANVSIGKVEDTLRNLETTFHATIATVNELGEVLNYSTNPHEMVQFYKPLAMTDASLKAIMLLEELQELVMSVKLPTVTDPNIKLQYGQMDITTDPKKIVKAVKNIVSGMILLIKELGVFGGSLGVIAYIILLERLKRKCLNREEELLYTFSITHSVEVRSILLDAMENDKGYDKIVKHSSAKVLQMLNILKEYSPKYYNSPGVLMKVNKERKPLSGIIFTQQRFTAKVIYNLIKEVKEANPAEFGFIKHDFLVGFNVNPFKSTREQHYLKKASQRALLKFSNKELNCLISTSVIEEGVDIPQCLLVLRYDPPIEYRSYIQSKGRARSSDSSYVILVEETNRGKFSAQYRAFQETERYIQSILVGSTADRDAPTKDDIQEGLYDDDKVPPYITQTGSRLSAASAISLLNRYCSMLPHDQFTVITPMWIQEKVVIQDKTMRVITIIMPIACPVKDRIKGNSYEILRSAKRSAALNACIRLHQEGELDAITLLPKQYGIVDFEQIDVKQCFPNWPWDKNEESSSDNLDAPKPGSKKMMRKHPKVFPKYLQSPSQWKYGQRTFFLHVIHLKAAFNEPKDSRERALFNLLQRGEGFGLLTPNPLPKICDFPMFLTVGEVAISMEMNYAVINLDLTLFDLVKEFHYFIFDQVLDVAKKFLVFDGTENNMFVVPTIETSGHDIDWNVMQTYKHIRPVEMPSYEERKNLVVTREDYKYCVVTPWYRGTIMPDRYIVSDVIEYMTPQSFFDTTSYGTYENYYNSKYNLELFGKKDQPLLEVRNISTRMNCLMPRAASIKSFTEKQQKLISAAQGDDKPKGFSEFFIPEFCIKYDFPGVLWYKAILLPSIVHRVFMLLVAHELREEIVAETKYGKGRLDKGEEWKPIQVDIEIAKKSLLSHIEEPTPVNTIDRINNPIDDSIPRPLNIVSMKETIYQLQNKKISKEYPWDETMEPVDIERNLSSVTVMDIECYDEFVSAPLEPKSRPDQVKSPVKVPTSAAILPPPLKYNDKIGILSKKPTDRGPELKDILAALTTINSGDTFNLERVETLGDSFLKFAGSLYLFHKFPKLNEGQLTNIKSRLIGNRNLYYAGARVRLGGRMKVEQFSPRKDFLVPGFFAPKEAENFINSRQIRPTFLIGMCFSREEALQGSLSEESLEVIQRRYIDCDGAADAEPEGRAQVAMQAYIRSQAVSDKSVADCVEALVGTYLLSGGILAAVKLLEWMRVLPPQDHFAQLLHKSVSTVLTERKAELKDIDFLLNNCGKDIENIMNYKFKDPSFLLEAMSHPSYIRNRLTRSYERLEFLGDAILDFLITSHIFENCRTLRPGELTDLRSALVNNVTFASYVVKLGLYKFLCSQLNPSLDKAIMAFVEHQEQRDHEVIEEVLYLIDEDECHIAEYVEVPKVLSDIFESLIGAIFLDSGGDLAAVWAVIYRIMWKEIDAFSARIPQQPVRVLYEKIHACPVFGDAQVTNTDVPKVMIPVTVTKNGRQHTIHGFGNNKFQAKRAAAKLALKILAL
ncbi:endoribonuclease Dicer isoform X1 [Ostrinia furnacalis]|uniref:endoribonuclease Dicer isoform X1 n=1 Tax=Ostrinia furnacalis TaxID=93504 RepID=UPI001038F039|nr:endoribonuclease Dicer isoform X1 [Ostrinia furnacalis]XP_028170237.1 endoribonuclease Dicer isoform X2 [Ostrinia furnacalis]XP_028170238.1 endoribonuclease Dicer isoform X1 [Ostrinia furnacalis]